MVDIGLFLIIIITIIIIIIIITTTIMITTTTETGNRIYKGVEIINNKPVETGWKVQ